MNQFNEEDIIDLAAAMLGMENYEADDVMETLWENQAMTVDDIAWVVSKLLPMIDVGTSPLTGKRYKGFATDGFFHVKQEIV